jgi:hypothetical protein
MMAQNKNGDIVMGSWFKKMATFTLKKLINEGIKKINQKNETKSENDIKNDNEAIKKIILGDFVQSESIGLKNTLNV